MTVDFVNIPNLPAATALSGIELIEGVQAGTSVAISTQLLFQYIGGTAARITVDKTAVTSGGNGRLLYDNAGLLGELPSGGTGQILSGNAGAAPSWLPAGTTNQLLVGSSGAAPTWQSGDTVIALANGAYTVPTLAALKALSNRPPVVITQGYNAANDGGGGPPWQWVAGSTATADDFMVATPASGPAGRYIRQLQAGADSVSPKWGGCGLGATDDSAQFQKIVNFAASVDMSGCTVPLLACTISNSSACAKIFSDGSGVFTPATGATSSTIIFTITKDTFWFDGIVFNLPISHTSGVFPACDRAFVLGSIKMSKVTNCEYIGGKTGLSFTSTGTSLNDHAWIENNYIHDCLGQGISMDAPRMTHICRNTIENTGYDASLVSGVIRINGGSYTNVAPLDATISENIITNCNVGLAQEAIDLSGSSWRNIVCSNNLIDNVGYGGFEFKTNGTVNTVIDVYRNWLFEGNIVTFPDNATQGTGISINNGTGPLSPIGKMGNIKIVGNYFLCATASTTTCGVLVSAVDNVSITGNTMLNLMNGITVNPGGTTPTEIANSVDLISNNIYATGGAAINLPARNVNGIRLIGNTCFSNSTSALQINGTTVTGLVCTGNHFETTFAGAAAVELRDCQGIFKGNTIVATTGLGIIVQGTAPTNLRIVDNDIRSTGNGAFSFVTASATIFVLDNKVDVPLANPIISGAAATTPICAGNRRLPSATDPTGTTAGFIGDIVPCNAASMTNISQWICTTTGTAGTAVWRAQSFQNYALGNATATSLQLANGAVATPSLSFASATLSGLCRDSGTNGVDIVTNGKAALQVSESGAAGFFVQASSNNTPSITAMGPSNAPLQLSGTGDAGVDLFSNVLTKYVLRCGGSSTAVNYFIMTAAPTGNGPIFQATGSDTDVDLRLQPKGAGLIRMVTASSIVANGSVAVTMTSLGPTGASTTIREWLAIKNTAGAVRYIPLY